MLIKVLNKQPQQKQNGRSRKEVVCSVSFHSDVADCVSLSVPSVDLYTSATV